MLDIELFQNRILEVFVPEYRSQTASEKEAALREYLKTIQDNYDEAEMLMEDKDGYFSAGLAYSKLEQEPPQQDTDAWKRKKKKKELLRNDFYKFQIKAANDKKAIELKNGGGDDSDDDSSDGLPPAANMDSYAEDNLDDKLEDPDYLKKRKQNLAASFQEQLAELNKKKLKTE